MGKSEEVKQRCIQKVQEQFANTATNSNQSYSRFFTHMGNNSQELLIQSMLFVDKFVEDTNKSTKNEQTVLSVKSQALKRQLAREVAIKYKESANLFTEFKKNSDQFIIKRWYKRNQVSSQQSAVAAKP